MKKVSFLLVSFLMSVSMLVNAQEQTTGEKVKDGAKKTGKSVKRGAQKIGNKTAEVASKATAKVIDRTYDGKVAPNGRTVYITEDSRYYWVNEKGRRIYVREDQLKDKPMQ